MPGAQPDVSRYGDKSEALAEAILTCFAFTVPVPRPADVGADFFCTLAHPDAENHLHVAGASFIVQAKSNTERVVLDKQHAATWFLMQKIPYFLGVVTRSEMKLDLYSTWRRTDALMSWGHTKEIILKPDEEGEVTTEGPEDAAVKTIYLGQPVASVTLRELVDPKPDDVMSLEKLVKLLNMWIEIDQTNINNAWAGIHYTVGPPSHETNVIPSGVRPIPYINEKNIPKTLAQLHNNTEFLRAEYKKARPLDAEPEPLTRLRAATDDVLRFFGQAAKPAP